MTEEAGIPINKSKDSEDYQKDSNSKQKGTRNS